MSQVVRFWQAEIGRNWVVAGVLLVWLINAGMNFNMGLQTGGDDLVRYLYAAMFFAVAGLGAYAATALNGADGLQRAGLLVVVICQIGLGQMAGWQTLGLTLSRGAAALEDKADQRGTARDALARARAERTAIGHVRPAAAIAAEARLECSRRRGGVGPRCTGLRRELAMAERAKVLDRMIPTLMTTVASGPKIADANAHYQVPAAFASMMASSWHGSAVTVTAEQVRFVWLVFLVALMEFIATLGFWLFGVRLGRDQQLAPASPERFDPALLPAPPRPRALPASEQGESRETPPRNPPTPPAGGGATNIINVGPTAPSQHLPPRIARRRNLG